MQLKRERNLKRMVSRHGSYSRDIILGVIPSIANPMDIYCDNNGAIAQAKEPISHQRSKHILRRFHLIREIIERGDVKICRVHNDDNVVNPLTKPLPQS